MGFVRPSHCCIAIFQSPVLMPTFALSRSPPQDLINNAARYGEMIADPNDITQHKWATFSADKEKMEGRLLEGTMSGCPLQITLLRVPNGWSTMIKMSFSYMGANSTVYTYDAMRNSEKDAHLLICIDYAEFVSSTLIVPFPL